MAQMIECLLASCFTQNTGVRIDENGDLKDTN
jgi:hypothetical protein